MNFIQVGDIHIRIRPELPEEWQVNRFRLLFAEIVRLCTEHQAVLFLSGDIADRNRPSLMETKLLIELFALLSNEGIDTWLISGNHEAIGQGESTFDYFVTFFESINANRKGQIHYNTTNFMVERFTEAEVEFVFVGHPLLPTYPLQLFPLFDGTRVLVSHFRATINAFIREEIDVESFIAPFDYCFASDIHEPLELCNGKLVYTNCPLNRDFEKSPKGGCLLISCDKGQVTWKRIPLKLPNLVQICTTAELYTEPPDNRNFYRVEIKGASADLRGITTEQRNVKLLKLPEMAETYVEQETEEVRDLALTDALIAYMDELGFSSQKVQDMMEVYLEP